MKLAFTTNSHRQSTQAYKQLADVSGGHSLTLGGHTRIFSCADTPGNRETLQRLKLRIHKKQTAFLNSL